jgi:signal transduction histidine kinase
MPSETARRSEPDFLSGGGEMGERIRNFDWSKTTLRTSPAEWSSSLKTAVSLILNSQHPMWIGWGHDMAFLYNDAYFHVLGQSKHPWALGRPAAEVWAEIWDVCGPLADKVFDEGQASFVDEVRLFMSRGNFLEEVYYSFSYSPIRDESGKVGGLFCPSNDVTSKVLNARRLKTLSELAANALVEKTTRTVCSTAAATLAKNSDDIPFALLYLADADKNQAQLEQTVHLADGGDLLTPTTVDLNFEGAANAVWPIAKVFMSGQAETIPVNQFESLPRGAAGQPVSEAAIYPVAAASYEKPVGVLVVGVNPTRRLDAAYQAFFGLVASHVGMAIQNARGAEKEKERLEMLAELDRAKTIFFSNVSHEFRTPLTLMLGPIEEMLKDSDQLPPSQRERLEIAHRNNIRLLKLVNSLLDFSRIEAGRLNASYEPVDLATLTSGIASHFRSAMQAAGLELIVDCRPLRESVYVDRDMWEKIVLNLLSNAFKFTFNGTVTVSVREHHGHASLTVSDTGEGIPDIELPRMFERFHRVEGTKGLTYEGSGIGLALVQELVKLHGGTIGVYEPFRRGQRLHHNAPFWQFASAGGPHQRVTNPSFRDSAC